MTFPEVPSALPDPDPADCVFCGIVAGRLPSTRVAEDDRTVSFLDINPATRGHVLVVPRAHARDLMAVDPADLAALGAALRCAALTPRCARYQTHRRTSCPLPGTSPVRTTAAGTP